MGDLHLDTTTPRAPTIHRDAPSHEGGKTAALGDLLFLDAADGVLQMEDALSTLRSEGFEWVLAPMDGDTWHRYRVVTESDGSPPFAMEPVSGKHDLAVLQAAGFSTLSRYVSSRIRLEDAMSGERHSVPGISIETWDGDDGAGLFGTIYDLSSAGFARAPYFKPISRKQFVEMYRPVVDHLDPRRVHFAKAPDGRIVGYLFGMPDLAGGASTKTVILKTYASAVRGVGRMLADAFHTDALRDGYETAVHALMHEDNVSLDSSRKYGAVVFRRYDLMGCRL
jgi:hypothetical protein